jgi:hypothetical protein
VSRWRLVGGGAAAAIAIFAIYTFFLADESVGPPSIRIAFATAVIGEGEEAVGVTPYGELLSAQPAPAAGALPSLPDVAPPKSGRLSGPMLSQAKVLGAAPGPLRPCIARSYYGESGVDVELRSGIELFFGDATRVDEKWSSAITVLANPEITALDYVDLRSPIRPSTGGSSHSLPAVGEGEGEGCGA